MRLLTLYIFALLLAFGSPALCQVPGISAYTIALPVKSEGFSVTRMNDGNFYMYTGPGTVCFDSMGNVHWFKRYLSSGYSMGKIRKAAGGNVHLMIHSQNMGWGNGDILFLNQDSAGNCIWAKLFGTANSEAPVDFVETSSGNILITASADGLVPGYDNMMLMAIGRHGDQLWQKIYTTDIAPSRATSMALTPGNGAVMTGRMGEDGLLICTDSTGSLMWAKAFQNCRLNDVTVDASGGNIYYCGSRYFPSDTVRYELFAGACTGQGAILWNRSIGTLSPAFMDSAVARCIIHDSASQSLIMGGSYKGIYNSLLDMQSLSVSLGLDGSLRSFLSSGSSYDECFSDVLQNNDGSYIFCGYKYSNVHDRNIFLSGLSSDGLNACLATYQQFRITDTNLVPTYDPAMMADTMDLYVSTFCIPPVADSFLVQPLCPVGMADLQNTGPPGLHIYPNPATGLINIEFENNAIQSANISICSTLGQEVRNIRNYRSSSGNNTVTIATGDLPSGIYIIQLYTEQLYRSGTFIRQ